MFSGSTKDPRIEHSWVTDFLGYRLRGCRIGVAEWGLPNGGCRIGVANSGFSGLGKFTHIRNYRNAFFVQIEILTVRVAAE